MSGRNFNLADYATVDDRITRYWALHPKPEGSIQTEIIWVSQDGNSVAIKATVYMGDRILATGIAQEERGKTFKDGANFTSWWENCETSAIGRALANMDLSLSKSRPSQQEMAKVQRLGDDEQDQSPAPRQTTQYAPAQRAQQASGGMSPLGQNDQPASEKQIKFIKAIARDAGLDEQELADWCRELYDQEVDRLNRRDASTLIEALQRRRNEIA